MVKLLIENRNYADMKFLQHANNSIKVSLHSSSAILLLNGNHEKGCMIWNVKKTPTHFKRSGRLTDFRPPDDAPHSPIVRNEWWGERPELVSRKGGPPDRPN